jgi:hypothetical protein
MVWIAALIVIAPFALFWRSRSNLGARTRDGGKGQKACGSGGRAAMQLNKGQAPTPTGDQATVIRPDASGIALSNARWTTAEKSTLFT